MAFSGYKPGVHQFSHATESDTSAHLSIQLNLFCAEPLSFRDELAFWIRYRPHRQVKSSGIFAKKLVSLQNVGKTRTVSILLPPDLQGLAARFNSS